MNCIFNLMGIPIKEARNIEFIDNEDGTFQLSFNTFFYDKKTNKNHDMRVHIPKLKIDPISSFSMLPDKNNHIYTIAEVNHEL